MGLFDSLTNTLSNLNPFNTNSTIFGTNTPASGATNAVRTVASVLQNIGSTLTFGVIPSAGNISSPFNTPLASVATAVANNPLTTAGVIAVPASGAARSAIGTAVSGLSTGTKIAGIAAAPIAVGLIRSNPIAVTTAALNAPSAAAGFGTQVGQFAASPSYAGFTSIIRDHPILSAAAGTIAIGAVAGGVGTAVNALNTAAVRANTKATEASSMLTPVLPMTQPEPAPQAKAPAARSSLATPPSVADAAAGAPIVKPKAAKKKAKPKPKRVPQKKKKRKTAPKRKKRKNKNTKGKTKRKVNRKKTKKKR
jgi:hypothetical protein